jgi:hypothetical protein
MNLKEAKKWTSPGKVIYVDCLHSNPELEMYWQAKGYIEAYEEFQRKQNEP